jgi:SPP1 family predicted phage head-tail adaptor
MNIGRLDSRITIERKVVTQDPEYGTELVTWAPLATVWAEVEDALPSKAEGVTMGLATARNQVRIRFRWMAGVDSSMRVTVHGDTDEILQIVGGPASIGGRKAFMEIMCERYS